MNLKNIPVGAIDKAVVVAMAGCPAWVATGVPKLNPRVEGIGFTPKGLAVEVVTAAAAGVADELVGIEKENPPPKYKNDLISTYRN